MRGAVSPHGTISRYRGKGCRCVACRDAWSRYVADQRERLRQAEVPADKHGTVNGYTNYGCRCPSCSAVQSAATSDWYRHAKPDPFAHGRRSNYRRGCRCERCLTAEREYQRTWRAKRAVSR